MQVDLISPRTTAQNLVWTCLNKVVEPMLNFWPVNKLRDIALKNIIVSAPHLANPTIKPRCYSGRGGGFYP